jgi:uncharacterized protein Yka (UPF0111/DUF47 family)
MFGWFQRLLPKSGDFFSMFERHAATMVGAAEALVNLTNGEGSRAVHIRVIRDREHDADEVIREVLHAVRRTFLTPFDRGAITSLIGAMDDTVDEMHAASSAVEIYDVTRFEPQMSQIAVIVLEASRLIAEAAPLLRDVERNGHHLHELTSRIVALEGQVDTLHASGLKAKFEEQKAHPDPLAFIVNREIYKHLERIADAFEDVANEIDALVVDHA